MGTTDDTTRHSVTDLAPRTPVVAHDPSRLIGSVVEATIDGWRRTCRVIAVGTGGVQLLDQDGRGSVLVPPGDVPSLELAVSGAR